eukprot:11086592-Alexandrium_andersonii.AAC.1
MAVADGRTRCREDAVEPPIGADSSQRGTDLVATQEVDIEVASNDDVLLRPCERDELREVTRREREVGHPGPDIRRDDDEGVPEALDLDGKE